jgi:hypothetical protein
MTALTFAIITDLLIAARQAGLSAAFLGIQYTSIIFDMSIFDACIHHASAGSCFTRGIFDTFKGVAISLMFAAVF